MGQELALMQDVRPGRQREEEHPGRGSREHKDFHLARMKEPHNWGVHLYWGFLCDKLEP